MAATVSDFMLERLTEWGVDRIYGYPGDGINGILGALSRAEERFDFIQVPHEEVAAFMACAHGKFTGQPGVCMATSGPGAVHLLNGLYDARLDHAPVVAIVGQQKRTALGAHYQQEIDLATLFKDVAGDYVQVCMAPAQMRHLVDRAMRIAMAERTVTCIIVPADVQEMDAVPSPPRAHGSVFSSVGYAAPKVVPKDADLGRAAEVLNAGKQGRDGGRRRRARGDRRGHRGRRDPRRRRRQGAARPRRGAGRPALRHRPDGPARHAAEL